MEKKISHQYHGSTHYIEFDTEQKEIGEENEWVGSGEYANNSNDSDVEYCGNHFSKPISGSPPYQEHEIGYINKHIYEVFYVVCPICQEKIETRRIKINTIKL